MKVPSIKELTPADIQRYDQFVHDHPFGTIHQLWEWGEFQGRSANRDKFWVLALQNDSGSIEASALIIRQKLPFNKCWLYCPRGPLVDYSNTSPLSGATTGETILPSGETPVPKNLQPLFDKIAELARRENAVFLRFDPPLQELSHVELQSSANKNVQFDSELEILHSGLRTQTKAQYNGSEGKHQDTTSVPTHEAKRSASTNKTARPGGPTWSEAEAKSVFRPLKSRPAHAHYQPESTLIIDLTPEPDRILAQMKPKGRYNIKVAQKHGITVRISGDTSAATTASPQLDAKLPAPAQLQRFGPTSKADPDLQSFYALLNQTTTRDKFSGHPLQYYQNMLSSLGPGRAKLYLAEYKSQIIAAAIVTYFKDTATYYFGASSNEHRNVMAPYLLHWQIMQDARAAGYKYYDFFGITPIDERSECASQQASPEGTSPKRPKGAEAKISAKAVYPHPWSSVTEFKLKFGGTRINYLPAQEIVYQPFWYALIKLAKRILGRT